MLKAPDSPMGQRPQFRIIAVLREGKCWYRAHDETKYLLDVIIDAETLARDYPKIY